MDQQRGMRFPQRETFENECI